MNLSACASLSRGPETGVWYRAIQPQHWQTSLATAQTKVIPSRFNEGAAAHPQFEVLYLSENHMVALFEVEAMFASLKRPGSVIPNPRHSWITVNVTVQLRNVADLAQVSEQNLLGTTAQELTGDWLGYQLRNNPTASVSQPVGTAPTQALGAALFAVAGLEGFRTISAKLPYYRNLVVFPQKLQRGSRVEFYHPPTGQRHVIP